MSILKLSNQLSMSQFIALSAGKFITITFLKKDGTIRKLNGRTGVVKHLKGGVSTVNTDKYFVLFDTVAQGYRCVNKDTILGITCGGLTIINNRVAA